VIMRHVATNVQEEVVAGSGHWLMEERPAYTVALIRRFLDGPPVTHNVASSADGDADEERLGGEWRPRIQAFEMRREFGALPKGTVIG
jgi:hypothetical protein